MMFLTWKDWVLCIAIGLGLSVAMWLVAGCAAEPVPLTATVPSGPVDKCFHAKTSKGNLFLVCTTSDAACKWALDGAKEFGSYASVKELSVRCTQ